MESAFDLNQCDLTKLSVLQFCLLVWSTYVKYIHDSTARIPELDDATGPVCIAAAHT